MVLGWPTGVEPVTAGATIQCSTIELRPPCAHAGGEAGAGHGSLPDSGAASRRRRTFAPPVHLARHAPRDSSVQSHAGFICRGPSSTLGYLTLQSPSGYLAMKRAVASSSWRSSRARLANQSRHLDHPCRADPARHRIARPRDGPAKRRASSRATRALVPGSRCFGRVSGSGAEPPAERFRAGAAGCGPGRCACVWRGASWCGGGAGTGARCDRDHRATDRTTAAD